MIAVRVHVGSGPIAIAGWTNVDIQEWPGVDMVLDVRAGLPFSDVEYIFAEHFLEHLTLAEGLAFLRSCRQALSTTGILRLSTPNLDWVWLTHYKKPEDSSPQEQYLGCLEINRAFHGWGHRFLYNASTLELALRTAGFAQMTNHAYGESSVSELCGLERHDRQEGIPNHPSVLVVEAAGISSSSTAFADLATPYLRDFAAR
jgi:predicted SAM-dependent methyltransferase